MNLPNINECLLSHESSVSGLRMLSSLFIPRLCSCFSCQKRKTLPTYIQKPRSGLCQHVPCQECTSRCTCTTPGHAKAGPHRHLVTPAHPAPRQYLLRLLGITSSLITRSDTYLNRLN